MLAALLTGGLVAAIGFGEPFKEVRSLGPGVNSGPAIQAALDSGKGARVLVSTPDPLYEVWPERGSHYPGKNCLEVRYSNVTWLGSHRGYTTISCKAPGGKDPNTSWEILDGLVWRGHGMEIKGISISNFTMRGLRLTGNSPRNLTLYPVWNDGPGQAFPADASTGENWDITNKGVFVGNGSLRTNIVIEDCEIDSFRGELVYYGGSTGLQRLAFRRSYLHDSIGSIFSCSGNLTVEDSEISYGENAIENTPFADAQIFQRNYIHDNKIGVVITSNAPMPNGALGCLIKDNRLHRNFLGPAWMLGAVRNVHFLRNVCTDNSAVLIGGSGGGAGPAEIAVDDNLFRVDSAHGGSAEGLTGGAVRCSSDLGYPIKSVFIRGNRLERSIYYQGLGGVIDGVQTDGNLDPGSVITQAGNDWTGGGA